VFMTWVLRVDVRLCVIGFCWIVHLRFVKVPLCNSAFAISGEKGVIGCEFCHNHNYMCTLDLDF
jgi:hypothetical protein